MCVGQSGVGDARRWYQNARVSRNVNQETSSALAGKSDDGRIDGSTVYGRAGVGEV
jgi:hypothetical protein